MIDFIARFLSQSTYNEISLPIYQADLINYWGNYLFNGVTLL